MTQTNDAATQALPKRLVEPAVHCTVSVLVSALVLVCTRYVYNSVFWIVTAAGLIAGLLALGYLVRCLYAVIGRQSSLLGFQLGALMVFGLMLAVVTAEIFLGSREQIVDANKQRSWTDAKTAARLALVEKFDIPLSAAGRANIVRRHGALTMPQTWKRGKVKVPGSHSAHRWHDVLFVFDENGFRRTTPFPPRDEHTFRLMVVGDSMTYGYGVAEQYTYTELLQQILGEKYRIEVVNLGINGWQSEDILNVVETYVPQLQPDLVFYGVVINDFLPSQAGQYNARGYELPISPTLKRFVLNHSRFARFAAHAYDASLRSAGLRKNFFDDILEDFEGYQQRFGRNVKAMNAFVIDQGLPPVVAMVLDQLPTLDGDGHQIAMVAEHYLRESGMEVIELEKYYRRYHGLEFRVSLWEGHADEHAHAIFASMIASRIETQSSLQLFRKTSALTAIPGAQSLPPGSE